jgi:simple sugar transport system permease protein
MKNKLNELIKSSQFASFSSSIIAIFVGLIFGLIILLASNVSQAMDGFRTILFGGFTGGAKGIGQVLYFATPIIMTGLSVGFAFKTGLFNIGASGQLIVGAYVAVLIGVKMPQLAGAHWVFAVLGAMIAGGIWALIPGLLKAYLNVNEVISSIMMNYIGMYTVNALVVKTIYDKLRNQSLPTEATANIPKWGLNQLFPGSSINGGILIAIFFVIIIHIILNKTTFGYELIACGHNSDASKYAGINAKKNIVLSMVIAGALAGIGGSLLYLAGAGKYIEVVDVLAVEGFNGIPVALLGLSNPVGILFAAMFIAYITVGGFYMQLYNFVPQVIDIIIASIIYFSAFSLIVKNYIGKLATKRVIKQNNHRVSETTQSVNEEEKQNG